MLYKPRLRSGLFYSRLYNETVSTDFQDGKQILPYL